ncbi:hypothetical protein EMN47_13140 [Prolixibacteraceae bacterium JC049]|nr:hypothetical protein [Prolixibacteraceae bacterium JC049]
MIKQIFKKYQLKITITLLVVILESIIQILFPLFIGITINDLINSSYTGLYQLIGLSTAALIIGTIRRFYDTRVYSHIYAQLSTNISKKQLDEEVEVSKVTARVNLLTELVEFFENDIPSIMGNIIGLIGTLIIILGISMKLFIASLIAILLIVIIYWLSGASIFKYNEKFNNELEHQVDILKTKSRIQIKSHFSQLMRWNIKLSDLESINYFFVWIILSGLLVFTIVDSVQTEPLKYGTILATVMYIFEFMSQLTMLPYYYQQLIRLKEISGRLQE